MKVYLAGPVLLNNYEASCHWREVATDVADDCGWEALNPIADSLSWSDGYRDLIVDRDLQMLKDSDLVVVNWLDKMNTVGTPMEMVYAKIYEIPCVVFANDPTIAANLEENAWLMRHNSLSIVKTFNVDNLTDILEWFDSEAKSIRISGPVKNDPYANLEKSPFGTRGPSAF